MAYPGVLVHTVPETASVTRRQREPDDDAAGVEGQEQGWRIRGVQRQPISSRTSFTSFRNERAERACCRLNSWTSAAWSIVGLYECPPGVLRVSQPLASRIASGSAAASRAGRDPR